MKTLETIQRFSRLGRTLSKTAFVLAVIGFCGCVLGIFSLALGSDGAIHWGGVTIHGILTGVEELGSVRAALAGWLILCAGEAVLAKFAERYFRNELTAGIALGVMFLVLSLLCRYGAEQAGGSQGETPSL